MIGRLRDAPSGMVSYRLARKRIIDSVLAGRLDRNDVCDAQPELKRVAKNHATPVPEPCPICAEPDLAIVTFAFGAGLPRGGRCVSDLQEMQRLRRRGRPTSGFRVEVCRSCWWNHLRESFPIGDRGGRRLLGEA